MKKILQKLFLAAVCGAMFSPQFAGAQFTEPDTMFYGEVINRTSGQIDLLNSGQLVWVIARPDGQQITLQTTLKPLNNGVYSYRLSVPHEALAYGLTVDATEVPLSAAAAVCSLVSITVNSNAASIVAPGTSSFIVGQGLRAATYRLDLELTNQLASTSGDGIPDWWKARYGVSNPYGITSADGWSNLQKYLNGGTPNQDNRFPSLLTSEYWTYADGSTEIPLAVVDSDSAATNITFTLTSLPANGIFYLRNFSNDVALALNSTFTLDDVNHGKFIFAHAGASAYAGPTSFSLKLCDENPAHATNYTVWLNVYRPNYPDSVNQAAQAAANAPFGFSDIPGLAFGEQQMLINYFLSRDHGFIVADSARFAISRTNQAANVSTDRTVPHVFVGGTGNDRLVGGAGNDIFIGGRGNDTLRGNGGLDLFIISGANSGNDVIEDFSTNNADALDISRALIGASWQLTNYVQLTTDGTNSYLGINYAGAAANYTNMTVTLLGTQFSQANLRALCDGGYLLTGAKALSPSVSIAATQPAASENGPVAGQFTLTRSGSMISAMTVNLTVSGSAVNGSSYQLLANQVTFAAGQRTLTIAVNPYSTADTLTQIVQVSIAAGTGYDIGAFSVAQVSIEPLAPQVSIAAVANTAEKTSLTPAIFSVTRAGIMNSTISVRLGLSGSASSISDYSIASDSGTISTSFPLLTLAANQTEAFIYITPKPSANLAAGPKYLVVTLKTNSTYKVMNPSFDRVFLVNQLLNGLTWEQMYFPNSSDAWNTFASRDTGNKGINNLYRYAFGLNPTNPVATNGLPAYQILNGRLCVTFRHPLSVTDYNYIPQVSDDLIHWSSLANDIEPFTPANANTNDVETVSFRSTATLSAKQKQFMRVTLQAP